MDDADQLAAKGTISGAQYQPFRSALSSAASEKGDGQQLLGKLSGAIDSLPTNSSEWNDVRKQYSLLKMLTSGRGAVDAEGNVSGKKLAGVMKGKDLADYMNGRYGAAGDVAKTADTFELPVGSPTAQRSFMMNAVTNPLMTGGSGAAAGGAAGYYQGGPEGVLPGMGAGLAAGILGPKAIQGVLSNPMVQWYVLRGGMGPKAAAALQSILPQSAVAGILSATKQKVPE